MGDYRTSVSMLMDLLADDNYSRLQQVVRETSTDALSAFLSSGGLPVLSTKMQSLSDPADLDLFAQFLQCLPFTMEQVQESRLMTAVRDMLRRHNLPSIINLQQKLRALSYSQKRAVPGANAPGPQGTLPSPEKEGKVGDELQEPAQKRLRVLTNDNTLHTDNTDSLYSKFNNNSVYSPHALPKVVTSPPVSPSSSKPTSPSSGKAADSVGEGPGMLASDNSAVDGHSSAARPLLKKTNYDPLTQAPGFEPPRDVFAMTEAEADAHYDKTISQAKTRCRENVAHIKAIGEKERSGTESAVDLVQRAAAASKKRIRFVEDDDLVAQRLFFKEDEPVRLYSTEDDPQLLARVSQLQRASTAVNVMSLPYAKLDRLKERQQHDVATKMDARIPWYSPDEVELGKSVEKNILSVVEERSKKDSCPAAAVEMHRQQLSRLLVDPSTMTDPDESLLVAPPVALIMDNRFSTRMLPTDNKRIKSTVTDASTAHAAPASALMSILSVYGQGQAPAAQPIAAPVQAPVTVASLLGTHGVAPQAAVQPHNDATTLQSLLAMVSKATSAPHPTQSQSFPQQIRPQPPQPSVNLSSLLQQQHGQSHPYSHPPPPLPSSGAGYAYPPASAPPTRPYGSVQPDHSARDRDRDRGYGNDQRERRDRTAPHQRDVPYNAKTKKCSFHFSPRGCKNGDKCNFSHVDQP
jgi:hypothetical protein